LNAGNLGYQGGALLALTSMTISEVMRTPFVGHVLDVLDGLLSRMREPAGTDW